MTPRERAEELEKYVNHVDRTRFEILEALEQAIVQALRDQIEECAKIADAAYERCQTYKEDAYFAGCKVAYKMAATEIRALASTEAKTEKGE